MKWTALIAIVLTFSPAARAAPLIQCATKDGLAIEFSARGLVKIGQRAFPLSTETLVWVRDAAVKDSQFIPVKLEHSGGAAVSSTDLEHPLGLRVQIALSPHNDHIELNGVASDPSGADRCIDLKLAIPIGSDGFDLGLGLSGSAPGKKKHAKAEDNDVDVSTPDVNAIYPLCAVSNIGKSAGLTVAVPPTAPTRFLTGMGSNGPYIDYRIGISKHSSPASQTSFHALIYRHDPAWGFRASLEKYYSIYREPFFTRRVKRIGAWTSQNASLLANKELYAYHEAGFPTWRTASDTSAGINTPLTLEQLDEGPNCSSLEKYEKLCELEADEKAGIYSLPYTIVGQRQILMLPKLTKTYDEAMNVLETWRTTRPILFDGPPQAVSFRTSEELKNIIRTSSIHDHEGKLQILARPYRGPTLTFPQNPNPRLYGEESTKETIAKYTLDYYLPMMFRSKYVDGCYLDSLGRWCGFYNFATEHFKYTSVPLTYAGDPPKPCLWNLASHAEYIWELGRRLHAQGKIFIANGIHPDRAMLGFACDVMGSEGTPVYDAGENFYVSRVAAGIKPYCYLNATHKVSPKLWNSVLYMGYLMGANSKKGLAGEKKYLPLIIKMNQAGWQPVTYARAKPKVVGVERWGQMYFTAMNRSKKNVDAELAIDLKALKLEGAISVNELVGGKELASETREDRLVISVPLQAEETIAIELVNKRKSNER
jgi:hypothetical protein